MLNTPARYSPAMASRPCLGAMLLLLCASACAANQSALPMPPPFNPVTDSPITIGHPGYVDTNQKPERSPHKRVLPQTPETRMEAGIWAAKDEPAHALFGLAVPLPPNASAEDERVAGVCVDVMSRAATLAGTAADITTLAPPKRRCVAAQIYLRCLMWLMQADMDLVATAVHFDRNQSDALDRAVATATEAMKAECADGRGTTDTNDLIRRTMAKRIEALGGK